MTHSPGRVAGLWVITEASAVQCRVVVVVVVVVASVLLIFSSGSAGGRQGRQAGVQDLCNFDPRNVVTTLGIRS